MKKIGLFFVTIILLAACNRTKPDNTDAAATTAQTGSGAQLTFKEDRYDFGKINEGDIVEHDFEFTNTGTAPLDIMDVKVQCGCTVASRPEGLVGVGKSDKITVRFNSQGKAGSNKKYVTVISNASNEPGMIEFTAEVLPKQ